MRGIDVSSYQGEIQYHTLKASGMADFVYAKATEGTSFTDMYYARNADVCRDLGIPFGAYHFFKPDADPLVQAQYFLGIALPKPGDLAPMVDVEVGQPTVAAIAAFSIEIEKALGLKPIIYSYYSFWQDTMGGSDAFAGHNLWIAESDDPSQPGNLPDGWNDWLIHQYGQGNSVPGVHGDCDLDRVNPKHDGIPIIQPFRSS